MEFIPASESPLFTRLFALYAKGLFYRRFKHVWIRQEYKPGPNSRTVYYLNHTSWWDGLVPLMLNSYRFRQYARAMMEDRQLKSYIFFRKLGTFSIQRDNPRKAIVSLRYAVRHMLNEHSSLFIYPQGKICPACNRLAFEGGLAWLHSKMPDSVDFVPVGIYMHTIRYDKPELFLHVGPPADNHSNQDRTKYFEQKLENILSGLRMTAGFDDQPYERFI